MKAHTSNFKEEVKKHGRQLDSIITYQEDGEIIELGSNQLNSVTPHYEGNILKSVMKQLDLESNVEIPIGTEINYQFGVLVNNSYEYLDFGNYIVKETEKKEDKNSYLIKCYDKILYSMKDYENMNITYPITIRDYLNTICNHLGLTFANRNDVFANYNKQIPNELYLSYNTEEHRWESLGYTFRDVLDEIAQATASTICINNNDELEIRYITNTSDVIDERYLKDVNVNFGEQYGPINTVILSRAGGSDNVYLSYPENIPDEDKIAVKISDNQIMNRNDRSDYLSDILNILLGVQYCINDFSSTGITYYDLCDRYTIQIGENQYSCVMFNDEINITQGLEENIHTESPENAELDYSKADKTDRRINQTYIIVDKQNQEISSVVSNVSEQNSKISTITQRVDVIESEISNISGMTMTEESPLGIVTFTETSPESEPIAIKLHPINESISYLYPHSNLFPSSTTYLKNRKIRFYNNTEDTYKDYELPDDLLYYDATHYDEFYLNYESQTCQIIKKCKYNPDGTVGLLSTPETHDYTQPPYSYPVINLTEGAYSVYPLGYGTGYIYVTLMAKNIYTDQFYTKRETDSKISQKADEIEISVNETLTGYSTTAQMNSAINIKANEITSSVSETYATKTTTNTLSSRISQTAKGISLTVNNGSTTSGITITMTKEDGTTTTTSGTIQMTGLVKFTDLSGTGTTTINGSNITTGTIDASRVTVNNINASKITSGTINASNVNITNINANNINSGNLSSAGINIYNGTGFLKLALTDQYHPFVSALNVASQSANPSSISSISFRNTNNRNNLGSSQQIGYISYGWNGGAIYQANGNMNVQTGGAYGLDASSYVRINAGSNQEINLNATGGCFMNGSNNARIYVYRNCVLQPASGYYAYVGDTSSSSNRIATQSVGPSSLNVKKNLVSLKNEYDDIYKDIQKIDTYNYDYKYKGIKDNQTKDYGFIIDEIEATKHLSKYFKNYKIKKWIDKDKLISKSREDEDLSNLEELEIKEWDRDSYIKGMFIMLKALQNKIDELEEKIDG